jgi:hypothetical protein
MKIGVMIKNNGGKREWLTSIFTSQSDHSRMLRYHIRLHIRLVATKENIINAERDAGAWSVSVAEGGDSVVRLKVGLKLGVFVLDRIR